MQCGRNSRISFSALLKVNLATERKCLDKSILEAEKDGEYFGHCVAELIRSNTAVPGFCSSGLFAHFEFGPVPLYTLWPGSPWFDCAADLDQAELKIDYGFEARCWGAAFA